MSGAGEYIDARTLSDDLELRAEFCIIGSGAGGAVLARELSELGRDVIVLEEGDYLSKERGSFEGNPVERLVQSYREAGTVMALGRPGIPIPVGKAVGGTTVINSGTCFRLPRKVLERWQLQRGLRELSGESLDACFDRVEETIGVAPASWEVLGKVAQVVRRGADALGLSHGPLARNAIDCKGSGECAFGCPSGAKQSMERSYLPRAVAQGARIYYGARVERVDHDGRRASGVIARAKGGGRVRIRVRADRTCVCCGTLYTPLLLTASKLPLRGRAHLGRHMTIHPASKAIALFDERLDGAAGIPQGYMIDHYRDQGLMFEGVFLPPAFTAFALPFIGQQLSVAMDRYAHLASFGFMITDQGRGRVRRNLDGTPLVSYTPGPAEMDRYKLGMEVLCRLYFAAGAREVYAPAPGMARLRSMAEAEQALRRWDPRPEHAELAAFHPLGTARMDSGAAGVVDQRLRVRGVEDLYVVDGSIFPSSLGVNPQMTIMAFATRAAEQLHAGLS